MGSGSAPTTSPAASAGLPAGGSGDASRLVPLLAAIGTGIGVLGFVAFVGAVVLWTRMRRAGLPADDAVAVVPKGALLAVGAHVLVPAVLLALAAAGLIVGVHELVRAPNRLKHMGKTRTAAELRYRAERAAIVVSASARALASQQRLAEVRTRAGQLLTPEQQRDLDALQATLDHDAELLDELEWKATRAARERDLARTLSPRWQTARRVLDIATAIAVIGLVPFLVSDGIAWHVSPLEVAVLIALAGAAVLAAVLTYLATDKIVWFGVVAFLAVGVLFCATSYYRTKRYPKVESVAVLVKDRPPRVGFLVARTSDILYLGTFRHGSGHQRVLAIPQERVTYAAIGPLVGIRRAERRALGLALDLCRQWVPRSDTVTAATPASHRVCSLGRRARITARLARWRD